MPWGKRRRCFPTFTRKTPTHLRPPPPPGPVPARWTCWTGIVARRKTEGCRMGWWFLRLEYYVAAVVAAALLAVWWAISRLVEWLAGG